MEKYHPLYAYAIVSVVLLLGIQMMLTNGTSGITGLAVGDQGGQQQGQAQQGQQGGQGQPGGQQGAQQQGTGSGQEQKQGFFQKVGGFFGIGDNKDTTGQAGQQQSSGRGGSQGQTQGKQNTQSGQQGTQTQGQMQEPYDDGTDSDGDGLTDQEEIASGTDPQNEDTDGDGTADADDDDSGTSETASSASGSTSGTTNQGSQGQPSEIQELSEESKECLDAIDENIKSCSEDSIQACLDADEGVECIMKAIGTCMEEYKDDKDGCFEETE